MSTQHDRQGRLRTRWSAVGAAIAITLGAGGLGIAQAAVDTGDRPITVSIAAERILDTRTSVGLAGRFADATPRDLQVTGSVPVASGPDKVVVPADATGVLLNVTVVAPTHGGFLSVRPGGAAGEPTTSTVNFVPGAIEPNGATVDLNNGQIQVWLETSSNSGSADVLIDVVGYTIDHTHDDRYYTETEADTVTDALDTRVTGLEAAVAPLVNSVAAFASGAQNEALAAADTIYRTVSLMPPADGVVIVNSSAHFTRSGAAGVELTVRCSIGTGAVIDFSHLQITEVPDTGGSDFETLSGTRAFDVSEGVLLTVNLVCDPFAGAGSISDSSLTAIFAPS
ncbi:MAG: hypothetical protein WA964_06270 [Ilumatobacter sp.]|uniref:hypothetical protein n=1 Tax=Ilumatobacter sp. TaxID=1967498 RepID=UPI003C74FF31